MYNVKFPVYNNWYNLVVGLDVSEEYITLWSGISLNTGKSTLNKDVKIRISQLLWHPQFPFSDSAACVGYYCLLQPNNGQV